MTIETKATLNSNSRVTVTVNGGCKETLKGAAETAVWNRDCKEVTILRQDGKNYTVKTEIPEEYQDKAIKALVKVIKAFAHGEIDSNEVDSNEVEAEVETAEVETEVEQATFDAKFNNGNVSASQSFKTFEDAKAYVDECERVNGGNFVSEIQKFDTNIHKFVTVYTNDAIVKEEPEMTIVEQYTGLTKERDLIIDSAQVTVEQAVAIIDRLNYRHCSFEYRHTTNDDIAEYRHFDAYRNGDKDAFAITEVVIDGLLDCVRFYNLFRNIRVDLKICKAEVKAEMTKISAKQVADAKATMELIQTRANNNEISDAEWNAAVDHYNAAKAIVAASEITAEQIGLTINTTFTNSRIGLTVDGNKISMANAFKAALAQDKAIVLRNEVGDFCIIDRDDDILTLGEFNFKTAIRQFANGEKVQGSTVMNKHQVHVIKAVNAEQILDEYEAQSGAQPVPEDDTHYTARITYYPTQHQRTTARRTYVTFDEAVGAVQFLRNNYTGKYVNHGEVVTIYGAYRQFEQRHFVFNGYSEICQPGEVHSSNDYIVSNEAMQVAVEAEQTLAEVKADLSAPLARLAELKIKVDRANEEYLKLSFAVHVSIHFYLNDLKSELFNKHIFPNQDRVREMLNPAVDAIYDELVAIDHLSGWDEYGELLDYCVKTAATGSSNAVWRQARNIADEIENKLGEQQLVDELKKIVDEYGISRDLLTKSGDCDFNPALFKPQVKAETPTVEVAKFEAGKEYNFMDFSTFDADESRSVTIQKRTPKYVYISGDRYLVRVKEGSEYIKFPYDYVHVGEIHAKFLVQENAEIENVYVDWEGEIIPAADYAEILDGLAITDYTTTAYRKNSDGTFTEDRAAWQKIREVEGTCEVPVRSVEPEPAPTPEPAPEVINGETLEIIPDCLKDGATLIQVDSPKYGATLTRYSDGRIYYRITTPAEYPTPSTARNVTEEEFFRTLAQRGAWTPDEPPTVDADEYAVSQEAMQVAVEAELFAEVDAKIYAEGQRWLKAIADTEREIANAKQRPTDYPEDFIYWRLDDIRIYEQALADADEDAYDRYKAQKAKAPDEPVDDFQTEPAPEVIHQFAVPRDELKDFIDSCHTRAAAANVTINDITTDQIAGDPFLVDVYLSGTPAAVEQFIQSMTGNLATDDFANEIARLQADVEHAKSDRQRKQAALLKAQEAHEAAIKAESKAEARLQEFGQGKAQELNARLIDSTIVRARIALYSADGMELSTDPSQLDIDFYDGQFKITSCFERLGFYDTPAQVTEAIEQLKATIERGDRKFTFPTLEKLNPTVQEVAAKCARINSNAPADWSVYYDSERGDFAVEYKERRVGSLTAYQLVAAGARGFFDKYAA